MSPLNQGIIKATSKISDHCVTYVYIPFKYPLHRTFTIMHCTSNGTQFFVFKILHTESLHGHSYNKTLITAFKFWRRMISILMLRYLVKINNLVFVGMKIPFHNPFCTVSAIHLDGVRSICSFIKCP